MFRLYSQHCTYAIRALSFLPLERTDTAFTASWLCRKADVPESFTRKALQILAKTGYLKTVTGPNGGYQLVKDPSKIRLLDLIKALEGPDIYERCILGFPQCNESVICPLHKIWQPMKKRMTKELSTTTLKDLIKIN